MRATPSHFATSSTLGRRLGFNAYTIANNIIDLWRSCLPCTALPYSHTAAYPQGVRHSMHCA